MQQEEQAKIEAECSKHERNLRILESKLKGHQDNIQAMRMELASKEEEMKVLFLYFFPKEYDMTFIPCVGVMYWHVKTEKDEH